MTSSQSYAVFGASGFGPEVMPRLRQPSAAVGCGLLWTMPRSLLKMYFDLRDGVV